MLLLLPPTASVNPANQLRDFLTLTFGQVICNAARTVCTFTHVYARAGRYVYVRTAAVVRTSYKYMITG